MIKAAIAGATGYTGAELVKLISGHPEAQLSTITSETYADKPFSDIFPAFNGLVNMECKKMNPDRIVSDADVVFLALPHKVSMKYAPFFVDNEIKVIDLSADFRFKNAATYEAAYQTHTSKQYMKKSVYGLSEVNTLQIKKAQLVGNPGCYPTSFLLPVIPLVKEGAIAGNHIISDSKSGVSGAGRSLSLTTHFCEANESFKPYKIGSHRHTPEMEEVLSIQAKRDINITFTPHLLPLTRGMLTTIYATASKKITENSVREILKEYYRDKFFIRLLPKGAFPDILSVKESNFCDIGVHLERETGTLIIVSAIDNLLKGAAGQAVQNMNMMFGLDEKAGLI